MRILRALVRISLLQQGPKLEPQGTPKGMKMKIARWIKNINDFYVDFERTCQDRSFAARVKVGIPRNSQRNENGKCLMGKKHKRLLSEFCAHLSGSHFCRKDPSWDPKGQPKEWKWEMSDGQKNTNDFYANFARACQDLTFAARIQVGTPRDTQRNENENRPMDKKHKRFLCGFWAHLPGPHSCRKDPSWDPKEHTNEWKWKMYDG